MPSPLDPACRFRDFRFTTGRAGVGRPDYLDSRLKIVSRNLAISINKTQIDAAAEPRTEVAGTANGRAARTQQPRAGWRERFQKLTRAVGRSGVYINDFNAARVFR